MAPASRIRCLARLMRWAMVASGTKKALAISAVVRPPTARSVSATCEGGVSEGWQHSNNRTSVSSRSGSRSVPGIGLICAAGSPNRDPVLPGVPSVLAADLVDQTARRHVTSQARGFSGTPFSGHALAAGREGLLRRILAEVQGLVASEDGAQDLRRQLPQQVLDADRGAHRLGSGLVEDRPNPHSVERRPHLHAIDHRYVLRCLSSRLRGRPRCGLQP